VCFFYKVLLSLNIMFIHLQICIFYVWGILQLKHHKAMWWNGRKFRIKKLDDKKKTSDYGITTVFQVTKCFLYK
jgi:hypothetical protein